MRFDYERAREVLLPLMEAYYKRFGIFGRLELPQKEFHPECIPKGSLEHAQFLFTLAPLVVAKNDSDWVIRSFGEIVTAHPHLLRDLFQTNGNVRQYSPETIKELFSEKSLGFFIRREQHQKLVENADWITQDFAGSPLNLYRGVTTIDQFVARFPKKRRTGYGPKTIRLFDSWCQDETWHPSAGQVHLLNGYPADIWSARFARRTGMLILDGGEVISHHQAEPELREFFQECCQKFGLRATHVSAAVWLVGSNLCRRYNPRAKNPSQFCEFCPLHRNQLCLFYIPVGNKEETHAIMDLECRPRSISGILPGMEDF